MILLDTHVWIWWVHGDPLLPPRLSRLRFRLINPTDWGYLSCYVLGSRKTRGVGAIIVAVSPRPMASHKAWAIRMCNFCHCRPRWPSSHPGCPGTFHRDPAHQLIVATGRIYGCPVVERFLDQKIRAYSHAAWRLPDSNFHSSISHTCVGADSRLPVQVPRAPQPKESQQRDWHREQQ